MIPQTMIEIWKRTHCFLLFIVVAIGYWIGRIPIRGSTIGVAAVLFVGLFFGALDAGLSIPLIVLELGLVLFVYTLGLANGSGLLQQVSSRWAARVAIHHRHHDPAGAPLLVCPFRVNLTPATTTGIFTGMSNNTPALASVLDLINSNRPTPATAASEAVVGSSVSYPLGVLARILVLALMLRLLPINFGEEAYSLRKQYPLAQDLQYRTIEVRPRGEHRKRRCERSARNKNGISLFGRLYRGDQISLISGETHFQIGDELVIAGTEEDMDQVQAYFRPRAAEDLLHEHAVYVSRRPLCLQ